ncbi:helix-turn-helix domain-containing protein [Brucella pituitosa]
MMNKKRVSSVDTLIGQRIRELRCASNKTQAEVAKACGVTFQQVQKYERGTNRLSVSRLIDVCKAIDVSPALFVSDIARQSGR